jgi:hypothetical protein
MGILEDVTKMKNEGRTDEEITSALEERGVSPKEINDAFNQAKIKNAVSDEDEFGPPNPPQSQNRLFQNQGVSPTQEIPEEETGEEFYSPSPQYPQQEQYYEEPNQQYQEYYPQENYYQANTDTTIEVAEQVFNEKIKKIKKQVEDLNEFKILTQTKLDNAIERLKKIENTIDRLQSAVLDKVGSYGSNLQGIKKEMSMMQDSFRKLAGKKSTHMHKPVAHAAKRKSKKSSKKK